MTQYVLKDGYLIYFCLAEIYQISDEANDPKHYFTFSMKYVISSMNYYQIRILVKKQRNF